MNAHHQATSLGHYWLPLTPNRYSQQHLKLLSCAKRAYYTTVDGRELLDCPSGVWCCSLGHAHPRIAQGCAASREQTHAGGRGHRLRYAHHGRGTVGMMQVHPNSCNVIPGWVKFSIDLRNATNELVDKIDAGIRASVAKASEESGLPIAIALVSTYPAQPFHADCVQAVARAAAKLGYSNMPAVSGAGYDAVYMARLAPARMIFIACKDGISHKEIEDAKLEHITAGCNVLLHAMLERSGAV